MPANDREWMRQYMRQYRAQGRDKGSVRNASLDRAFSGCDGEGTTLESGYHAYFMFKMGFESLRARGENVRLSSLECLQFITDQDPKKIHVGYFFDYDVTKLLEDLPWQKLDRLINRYKRTGANGMLFPLDYHQFQMDYMPRKYFKVRRMLAQRDDETEWSPWVEISDVGSFFQMSFLRAIQVWGVGTPEEHAQIEDGKRQRAAFDIRDFDEIARYNALECKLLAELMTKFRAACVTAGYVPRRWQGPGVLAETMLRAHGVPKSADVPLLNDSEFLGLKQFGLNAYYGGRFEVTQIGPVSVPVWQYDINSAYPHAMRFLPCLTHGKWEHVRLHGTTERRTQGMASRVKDLFGSASGAVLPSGRKGETFALGYGSFTPSRSASVKPFLFGFPMRTSTGSIVYPGAGKGWYWSFEASASAHQVFEVSEFWQYTRVCDCSPLAFVEEVYRRRRELGKDGPGLILKLGMNSLYGKMVQSIGSPKYSNAIWGSFITAFPRAMIQEFLHSSPACLAGQCGRDVVMVATDSVASLIERGDVNVCGELGGWSVESHPVGMFVVQPGVYFGSSGKPTKTRGFTRTVVDMYEEHFRAAFERMVRSGDLNEGSVSLPVQTFVGIRYALQRRDMRLLGQWIQYGSGGVDGKMLSFDWTSKRMPMSLNPTRERPWILTLPYQGSPKLETVPYSKDIGGLLEREEGRLAFADLPDWSPLGDIYE